MIPINLPIIGKEEIKAVTNVLKTGPLTNALGLGPNVTAFERDFAKFAKVGSSYVTDSALDFFALLCKMLCPLIPGICCLIMSSMVY